MGSGNFYFQTVNTKKNVKGSRSLRSFLVAGALLIGMPFIGKAQPVFSGGASQPLTVCTNSTSNDFSSLMTVTDPSNTENDTWDVSVAPTAGTLSGLPYGLPATGGTLMVSGFTYTPNPLYTGPDQFVIKVYDDGAGDTQYITINVAVTPLPSFTITSIPAVCAGATSTVLNYSGLQQIGPTTSTYAGVGAHQFMVPPGVGSVAFDVQGGVGGNDSHSPAGTSNPGLGGRVQGNLNLLSTGEVLNIYVGGRGGNGTLSGATGGFNGGGDASFYFFGCGGAGGGASDIRKGGNTLANRVVVAGGGAGNGWDAPGPAAGGNGGGLIGGSGANNVGGSHASGGTQSAGGSGATYSGWTPGQNGTIGNGGPGSPQGISGGGGGGYYGGGGGVWTGGGGGSSFADGTYTTSIVHTQGYNINDGIVSLTYVIPGTYTINWDGGATGVGFVDVLAQPMPATPITITVPPAAPAGTYTGTIYIANANCTSIGYPISVTINPIPDVADVLSQSGCNGDVTAPVIFSGSVPGTVFNWTNTDTTIGLAASGSGNIPSFTATNSTPNPVIALITVTPVANGCSGPSTTFTYTVNPTPTLTSSPVAPAICDSTLFTYSPTSATSGTSFTWTRSGPGPITGNGLPNSSGAGSPNEYLYNPTPNDVVVPYTYTLAANGCLNVQNVNVTVHPAPTLSSSLFPGAICNNTMFAYPASSLTAGTIFQWNRNFVAGIANSAATGSNSPNEILNNTTTDPIAVPYTYTLYLAGLICPNTQVVTVTVNPTPTLSSPAPAAQCNNLLFSYGPASMTAGTSFAWSRGSIVGISNPPNAGLDSINETLISISPNPVTVVYTYTLTANGCSATQNVPVVVYPKPTLSSAPNPTICDSTVFNYPPTSLTTGTTFTWTRAVVPGISNPIGAGFGNPNETLVNTTTAQQTVTYVFTLSANGCTNTQNVNLTVNPKPVLSSSLTPPQICDSAVFSYNPTSATAGCTFEWNRPYIPGIYAVQQSGINNPNQALINSTYVVVDVTYTYTLTANGCSNVQNVVVRVNPTPKLNPPYTGTVCSGSPFIYNPTSYTPGANYQWNRPQVTHIGPATTFGTGSIHETLYDSVLVPVYVDYIYRLSVNGCINLYTQTVHVKVNPTPQMPPITTFPPSNLCSGTMYQNFGTNPLSEGINYEWSATNADVFAEGANHQYALISFTHPGTAVVSLTSNVNNYGCTINNSYTVNVNGGVSENPQVIYYNGQFICLKNDNDTYQWGYDDARTLDSSIISGEINQNYNNNNPDFNGRNYWCITTKGGCMQKSYYNRPLSITNINGGGEVDMKVYPNPATQVVNVEINSVMGGNMQVEVLNMLGQKLDMQPVINNKASINVTSLPSGCYLIDCYRDGMKIATTRFIKN